MGLGEKVKSDERKKGVERTEKRKKRKEGGRRGEVGTFHHLLHIFEFLSEDHQPVNATII